MSPSKQKTVARKAQENLDYFTNNNDRTKITTENVSNSSVFNKKRCFSSQHLQKQKQKQNKTKQKTTNNKQQTTNNKHLMIY